MKIAWVSASPLATTGYGRVTREVAPRLMEKHDVVMIGGLGTVTVWGGKLDWQYNGKVAPTYPTIGDMSGKDTFPLLHPRYNFDIVMTLWDAFSIDWSGELPVPAINYVPIDSPMTRRMANYLKNAYKIVGMTEFGFKELARFFPPSKITLIEHGVNTSVFHPDTRLREIGRKTLKTVGGEDVPENAFIALDVATNIGERKLLPFLILTFKEFVDTHKDAYLLLYTNRRMNYPAGYDLDIFAEEVGLKNLIFLSNNPIVDSLDDDMMNILYNACDVFVNSSLGEGFGLPFLEAMACGLPCAATNTASAPELIRGRGWLIDVIEDYTDIPNWIPTLQQYHPPSKKSLLACLGEAYSDPAKLSLYSSLCREFALKFDWEKTIMPKWLGLLDEAEEDLKILRTIK